MTAYLVIACAAVLVGLVLIGIWIETFHDNWLQWLGMWGMVLALVLVFWPTRQEVEDWGLHDAILVRAYDLSWRDVLVMVALLLFALGTAVNVYRHRHSRPRSIWVDTLDTLPLLDDEQQRQVSGAGR
jgi:drug/metabolite transporter (DMT)-like permease